MISKKKFLFLNNLNIKKYLLDMINIGKNIKKPDISIITDVVFYNKNFIKI